MVWSTKYGLYMSSSFEWSIKFFSPKKVSLEPTSLGKVSRSLQLMAKTGSKAGVFDSFLQIFAGGSFLQNSRPPLLCGFCTSPSFLTSASAGTRQSYRKSMSLDIVIFCKKIPIRFHFVWHWFLTWSPLWKWWNSSASLQSEPNPCSPELAQLV